jgi:hypothetical protein
MRFQPLTSTLLVVLALSLFVTVSVHSAGPKEDIAAATMKWAQTLGQNDPGRVVPLYAADGVLWGTLSPTVRSSAPALHDGPASGEGEDAELETDIQARVLMLLEEALEKASPDIERGRPTTIRRS